MAQEWVYDASSEGAAPLRLNEASNAASAGKMRVLLRQKCASDTVCSRRWCARGGLLHCAARCAGSRGEWLANDVQSSDSHFVHELQRAGDDGVITGPLVGTVRRSSHDSFAVGDWVFTHGPWRTEFVASPADLVKIDTQLVSEMR
jgi:hypothetical protein